MTTSYYYLLDYTVSLNFLFDFTPIQNHTQPSQQVERRKGLATVTGNYALMNQQKLKRQIKN